MTEVSSCNDGAQRTEGGSKLLSWSVGLVLFSALVIYLVCLVHSIVVGRGLFGDGANFFLDLLSQDSIWPVADDSKHIRFLINLINQVPLVLSLKFGVDELPVLRFMFNFGLFLMPVMAYAYCFFLSYRGKDYRVFLCAMVALVVFSLPSSVFSINQVFSALAFYWVFFHYLLLRLKLKGLDWLVMFVLSVVLLRSHEGAILWGAVCALFALIILYKWRRGSTEKFPVHVLLLGVAGGVHVLFVLYWQFSHPVGEQTQGFLGLIKYADPRELWQGNTRISVYTGLLFLLGLLLLKLNQTISLAGKVLRISIYACSACLIVFMLYFGWQALQGQMPIDPVREYSYRFLAAFGPPLLMLLAGWLTLANVEVKGSAFALMAVGIAAGLIASSFWQISNNFQWEEFSNVTKSTLLNAKSSLVDPMDVQESLRQKNKVALYQYGSGWTWPVLGMSLQNSKRIVRMYKPEAAYMAYFDPPRKIPFVPMKGGDISRQKGGIYVFDDFVVGSVGE